MKIKTCHYFMEREQAIREHRKMWLWISKQVMKNRKNGESINIVSLKKDYLSRNEIYNRFVVTGTQFHEACFCCTFAYQISILQRKRGRNNTEVFCNYCPLNWYRKRGTYIAYFCSHSIGLYSIVIRKAREYNRNFVYKTSEESEKIARRIAKICYKIATLPEKEGVINL